jgi:hypothetical protein
MQLVLNMFPVITAKLTGDIWTKKRSAANPFPRVAYSFVPFRCAIIIDVENLTRLKVKRGE